MDANQHVEKQQVLVRKLVREKIDLKKFKRRSPLPLPPASMPTKTSPEAGEEDWPPYEKFRRQKKCRRFYGHGIPGVKPEDSPAN